MTKEQRAAVSACIEAFNIPRDCKEFVLKIYNTGVSRHGSYGEPPAVRAHLEVEHEPAAYPEV